MSYYLSTYASDYRHAELLSQAQRARQRRAARAHSRRSRPQRRATEH
ncbi:MAG: hypothetical protein ABR571_11645 [Jatrophihabitans sp.]